jgi:hypothetical protein
MATRDEGPGEPETGLEAQIRLILQGNAGVEKGLEGSRGRGRLAAGLGGAR